MSFLSIGNLYKSPFNNMNSELINARNSNNGNIIFSNKIVPNGSHTISQNGGKKKYKYGRKSRNKRNKHKKTRSKRT